MATIKIEKEIQRRQYVLEHKPEGIFVTLRWDDHFQKYSDPFPGDAERVKRYCATLLGREAHEVGWSFNEVGGIKVEYSDTFLTDSCGGKLSHSELNAFRTKKTLRS